MMKIVRGAVEYADKLRAMTLPPAFVEAIERANEISQQIKAAVQSPAAKAMFEQVRAIADSPMMKALAESQKVQRLTAQSSLVDKLASQR